MVPRNLNDSTAVTMLFMSQCCSCHYAMSSYVRNYSHADYIAFGNQQKSVFALCMNSCGASADYEPLNGQLNVNGISWVT